MKKIFLFAAAAMFIGTAANAQDVYKQTGGEHNLEVLFAPLGGNPISIGGIKYRTFKDANTAYRATVYLGFGSETSPNTNLSIVDNNFNVTYAKDRTSSLDVVLSGGLEKHFTGTDRLSPYYGAQLNLGFGNETSTGEQFNEAGDAFIAGGKATKGSFTVGATAFAGVDYYIADNLYLGTEIGFGVGFTSEFDHKNKPTSGNTTSSGPQGSEFRIAPQFVGQLRLGWLF